MMDEVRGTMDDGWVLACLVEDLMHSSTRGVHYNHYCPKTRRTLCLEELQPDIIS